MEMSTMDCGDGCKALNILESIELYTLNHCIKLHSMELHTQT